MFEAEEKGADNPILLDLDGNVTEGPGYNVFCVTDGVVATPDRNVLEGISRLSGHRSVPRDGPSCEVRKVPAAELREADEIFITGTAGGIVPVTRLDGRILGNDRPGAISERLREAYLAEAARRLACRACRLCWRTVSVSLKDSLQQEAHQRRVEA